MSFKFLNTQHPVRSTLYFPIAYFALSVYLYRPTGNANDGRWFLFWAVVLSIVAWVLGLVIGLFIAAIAQKPAKEKYFYLAGQLSILIIFMALLIVAWV